MRCPVCKSNLTANEYRDDHILMESDMKCTNCQRYKEFYAYGSTEIGIRLDTGWQTWQWSYDTDKLETNRINTKIKQVARSACSEWASIKLLRQKAGDKQATQEAPK